MGGGNTHLQLVKTFKYVWIKSYYSLQLGTKLHYQPAQWAPVSGGEELKLQQLLLWRGVGGPAAIIVRLTASYSSCEIWGQI